MWIYEEQGVQHFQIAPHDAIPVMIQGAQGAQGIEFEAVRDADANLQLQPEVLEWLEATPGQYKLWITPDFIEVQIADLTVASAFKLRWQGSYEDIIIMAVDTEIDHGRPLLPPIMQASVMRLIMDRSLGRDVILADSYLDDRVLVIDDNELPIRSGFLSKADFLGKGKIDHTEKGFFRHFEGKRFDGSFKKRRRK